MKALKITAYCTGLLAALMVVFTISYYRMNREDISDEIVSEPVNQGFEIVDTIIDTPVPTATTTPTPVPTPTPFLKPVPFVSEYSEGVEKGNVRYVSQLNDVENNGWGKYSWKAGMECTTACISMALSYLGIDAGPEEILDYSSRTVIRSCYGIDDIEISPLSASALQAEDGYKVLKEMMDVYMNDRNHIWSPVVLYISGNGHNHALLVIGKDNGDYLVLDPTPADIHRIQINESGEITTLEEDYLIRYTNDGNSPAYINTLGQWELITDAIDSEGDSK